MIKIKNYETIIEELTEMLMKFDKECNRYQTDVYLYYNEETQIASLDTFVNVGGNSWLDDDHYTIYRDKEHFNGVLDWYEDFWQIAEFLDISEEQLRSEIIQHFDLDEDEAEDLERSDSYVDDYLKTRDDYMETLTTAFNDGIEEMRSEYLEKAEGIMNSFFEEMKLRNTL